MEQRRHMKNWAVRLLLLLFGIQVAAGEDQQSCEKTAPPTAFTVECKMVLLPMKSASGLIRELGDDAKVNAASAKLDAMLASGEATLASDLLSQGTEHQRVESSSIVEIRYATDFDPPQLPDRLSSAPAALEALKNWPVVAITPVGVETRNTGPQLIWSVTTTSDPSRVVCDYEAQHVRLERYLKLDAGRLANGEQLFVEQPSFSTMKNTSSVTMENGKPKLIGVHVLPTPEGTVELFILTVKFTAPPKP